MLSGFANLFDHTKLAVPYNKHDEMTHIISDLRVVARTNCTDLRPAIMNYFTDLSDTIQFSKVEAPIFLLNYVA
jgi:hypothetical protein